MQNNKQLFESIFGRNMEDVDNLGYLKNIADAFPYFSPAQFYLLLQTKKDNPLYKKQIQKTAALFNNKYWLNYLLKETTQQAPVFIESFFGSGETIADVKTGDDVNNQITIDEPAAPETEPFIPAPAAESLENEVIDNPAAETIVPDQTGIEKHKLITEETVVEHLFQGIEVDSGEETTELNQPLMVNDELPASSIDDTIAIVNENVASPAEETGDETIEESVEVPEKEIVNPAPVKYNQGELRLTADVKEETLLFQPFHTSDYFASVGIKLNEEANASDRLGKQLKSFTQWLKTMKKIDPAHAEPLLHSEIAPGNIDTDIQKLAETSNREDEIITEAMADVLVQQGRINKAIEVLKKLSLLNPSKSTYFAAKIEQLKD